MELGYYHQDMVSGKRKDLEKLFRGMSPENLLLEKVYKQYYFCMDRPN